VGERPWWRGGVRFGCTGCGACCVSHGPYTVVAVSREDRGRLAAHLGLGLQAFTRSHCARVGDGLALRDPPGSGACVFLQRETGRCAVYQARPAQCRTYPFWPELMARRTWTRDVAPFCPGVGQGGVIQGAEIEAILGRRDGPG